MMLNGYLRKKSLLVAIVSSFLLSSCGSDNALIQPTEEDVRFFFDVGINGYQGADTRSETHEWKNGDCIYFVLKGENRETSVRAVYDDEFCEWKIISDGMFPSGSYSGRGIFISGESQDCNDGVTIDSDAAVYFDDNVSCEKTNTYVKMTTILRPMLGRLRFNSSDSRVFAVSGIVHCCKMRFADLGFETSDSPIDCSIGVDGFSEYVYGTMPATSRAISIAYDNQLYTATFGERILDAGKSGYIELPSESSHSGWELIKLSVPELGSLEAFDIGVSSLSVSSSIINNGNGSVSECGFCYSQSPSPTVNDAKVVYGRPSGNTFTKTITNLDENTPYHIRAYAVNESGVAYSSEIIVSTLAIGLPILSATTVAVEDGSAEAKFSAQIVSESNGEVSECGFCYSTNAQPDITDVKVQCDVSPTFSYVANSLKVGTRYYVRAYAINEKGVAYGEQSSFIGGGGKPSDDDLPRPNMIKRKQ